MEKAEMDFPMAMFLENDSVLLLNRAVVAAANIACESCENMSIYKDVFNTFRVETSTKRYRNCLPKEIEQNFKNYYENTVLKFNCKEYETRFRMKKSTGEALINFLKDCLKSSSNLVPLEKKVHLFLWLLASEASFSAVGTLFGLHKSSVAYIFHEIASLLSENKCNFIIWPSTEKQHLTSTKVHSNFNFPNCVGFIDAYTFKVGSKRKKKIQPEKVLLQAVCDDSLMFTDIHIGHIGVTKKSKVFRDSSLSHDLKNYVDFEKHILGDENYKLKKKLITPFNSEETVTAEKIKFNEVHAKSRAFIGHAFKLLKEKFVKIHQMDITRPEAVKAVLTAACVLHNFILLHEARPPVKQEVMMVEDAIKLDKNSVKTASEKRQLLCNYINYIF